MFARAIVLTLASLSLDVFAAEPSVFVDDAGKLVMPVDMRTALETSFPGFQHWQAADYREGRRDVKVGQHHKGVVAPFAILLDLNRDGREDLVLDGYDEKRSLLVCVVSNVAGYTANMVWGFSPIESPAAIFSWEHGERAVGLNRFFSLPATSDKDGPVFLVNYLVTRIIGVQPPGPRADAHTVCKRSMRSR